MGSLGGWEIVIIIGVLVLLFGAKRLPDMARSVGQSARVFKGEMKGLKNEDGSDKSPDQPAKGAQPADPPATPAPSAALPPAPAPEVPQESTRTAQPGHNNSGQ